MKRLWLVRAMVVAVANTKYPNDHVHFGTAGTLELGRRMAEKTNAKPAAAR